MNCRNRDWPVNSNAFYRTLELGSPLQFSQTNFPGTISGAYLISVKQTDKYYMHFRDMEKEKQILQFSQGRPATEWQNQTQGFV